MNEATLQRKLIARLKLEGCTVIKLTTLGHYGTAGWPDLLVLRKRARVVFVEVKREDGRLTPLQSNRLLELADLGFRSVVARDTSWDTVKGILES